MRSVLSAKVVCLLAALALGAPTLAQVPTTRPAPATRPATQPATQPVSLLDADVVHVPGIGGYLSVDRRLMASLRRAGVGRVRHFDWTNGDPGLRALTNAANHRVQSARLARLLTDRHRAAPGRPITIVCHSGGGAIVTWALEQLPDDVMIDRWILLAPALSPDYDLSAALRRVRHRAFVLSSEHDPVLGAGTRLMGTMDGVRTDAMGRVGVRRPPTADAAQYEKLVAMPYTDEWLALDNPGDHIGLMMPPFVDRIIAPLILGDTP